MVEREISRLITTTATALPCSVYKDGGLACFLLNSLSFQGRTLCGLLRPDGVNKA